MAQHDVDDIVPPGLVQRRVMMGRVSQVHRPDRPAEEGDIFEINGATYEITDVTERTVSDVGMGDARTEAASSLGEFRERMVMIDSDFEWVPDSVLYRYQFKRKLPSDED
ncbi:ASCH domain-containing protein [Halapricum salinum]|uniref:ASCH domain-containing protein n=1 Tax=Halapricum salinum TaxID=1457250 RepID=A0A4D6H9Y7_9EURY|nr:hypothetical protein [Halapricum salinum]QCC50783.1 ASCH domain-containing protein [Halapricum salinum]